MATFTPKTLVLKTATVGNVTLPAPADHLGRGKAGHAHISANFLSRGRIPSPRYSEPETNSGPRQDVADMAMPPAGVPAGPVGSPVGPTACRRPFALAAKRTAPAARLVAVVRRRGLAAVGSQRRVSFPGSLGTSAPVGSDCQSPDRSDDRTTHRPWRLTTATAWEATPATVAGK